MTKQAMCLSFESICWREEAIQLEIPEYQKQIPIEWKFLITNSGKCNCRGCPLSILEIRENTVPFTTRNFRKILSVALNNFRKFPVADGTTASPGTRFFSSSVPRFLSSSVLAPSVPGFSCSSVPPPPGVLFSRYSLRIPPKVPACFCEGRDP